MAYFALLWKARSIEKYRINYEKEKIDSILHQNPEIPRRTLYEKWSYCHYNTKKRLTKALQRCFPEGSRLSNFVVYLRTDQTIPNLVWKSVLGFIGGIILTYLCFTFFVFQLAISLLHATIMSSIIGVLLTLGLAFSYRARCLVLLLIPQFFSRVGRYTLTCYALVLILTGPATNTLKNSEVLSESMACSQEQLKTSVRQISESAEKPFDSMKDAIKLMMDRIRQISITMKKTFLRIHTLGMHIAGVFQNSFSWLNSIVGVCNNKLGTPYDRCTKAIADGVKGCKTKLGSSLSWSCQPAEISRVVCESFKPLKFVCVGVDYLKGTLVDTIRRKLRSYSDRIKAMLFISVHVRHSYTFSSNSSRSASQAAAGIMTEIRGKADPMLTWISWSSCVTSAALLLIIFRAKHYQDMFETRSRFDNRYVTKELRDMDLKRVRQGRETVLPLNVRERAKYVTTTSFRLVASEKLNLTRSAVFTAITTFKLLIHMVADYSLYWVLVTIRYYGRLQTPLKPGPADDVIKVIGEGAVASILRAIMSALSVPLNTPMSDPITCLPDPHPPDFQRYAQIGVLILLLWFFALLEPYGLRLRHIIMSLYSPARAKARAGWLYNHILRTRGSFLKYARRKLRRVYKYSGDEKLTFRYWVDTHIPFSCLRYLLGNRQRCPQCVLCGITDKGESNLDLTRCDTPNCPGLYCSVCFNDIRQFCTICLSPVDYGDLSDVSLEKGSSEESSEEDSDHDVINESPRNENDRDESPTLEADDSDSSTPIHLNKTRSLWFSTRKTKDMRPESIALLDDFKPKRNQENTQSMLQLELQKVIKKSLMRIKEKTTTTKKNLRPYTEPKNKKKNISFKVCNNPMIYTALVSYDNPIQPFSKSFCENRAKIVRVLNDLSASSQQCYHTSFWAKYNTRRRTSRPRKRNINLNLLHFRNTRKKRHRTSRDLTAFISSFYKIQRKGLRFSIAKIYSTSKIGKILRRKFKVIRRRRAKKKRQSNSSYQTVFSKNSSNTKIKNSTRNSQVQEYDSHELTEVVVSSPRNINEQDSTETTKTSRKGNNAREHKHNLKNERSSTKTDTESINSHDKSRSNFSDNFNKNFMKLLTTFFHIANNVSPVLDNKANYKRRKNNKQHLSESRTRRSNSQGQFFDNSECIKIRTDDGTNVQTSENVQRGQSTKETVDEVGNGRMPSESDIFKKPALNYKQRRFKKSILSVKKYCSNFSHDRKNNRRNDTLEKGNTIKPALQSAITQCKESGEICRMPKEGKLYYDAEVGVTHEACSSGVQYTQPGVKSYIESTSYTESNERSSTDTLTRSVGSQDTLKYEYEDPPSVDCGSFRMVKRGKLYQGSHSTETGSLTPNPSTVTDGWWSPMSDERRTILKRPLLEKRSFGDYQRVTAKQKASNIVRSTKCSLTTNTKLVSFRSKADIIPCRPAPIKNVTASRHMLQSERYYDNQVFNERSSSLLSTSLETAQQTSESALKETSNRKEMKMKRLQWQAAPR